MEEQNVPPPNPFENISKARKFAMMAGLILFVATGMLTVVNMGFSLEFGISHAGFMSESTMWIAHTVIGMVAGILFFPKKAIIASISGGLTGAAITGITKLYISFRDNLYSIEFIIPVLLGMIIGFVVFRFLLGKPKEIANKD